MRLLHLAGLILSFTILGQNAQATSLDYDIEGEYQRHHFFHNRKIDNYNFHFYKKFLDFDPLSFYYGGVVSYADGYLNTSDGERHNCDAFGLGPGIMARFEGNIGGNFYAGIDGSGALRFFNKAHPYGGRVYSFLWRIGPKISYRISNDSAISLGYMFTHVSNGSGSKNPGYNTTGFTLGYQTNF